MERRRRLRQRRQRAARRTTTTTTPPTAPLSPRSSHPYPHHNPPRTPRATPPAAGGAPTPKEHGDHSRAHSERAAASCNPTGKSNGRIAAASPQCGAAAPIGDSSDLSGRLIESCERKYSIEQHFPHPRDPPFGKSTDKESSHKD